MKGAMKGALVTSIAKVEGIVKETFSGAPPQTPTIFYPPPPPPPPPQYKFLAGPLH